MKIGVDTTFLVQAEIIEHPRHHKARDFLDRTIKRGHTFVITGQIIQEFLQVITDPQRFTSPLAMDRALSIAEGWWYAEEVMSVYPTPQTQEVFMSWMSVHNLGRKRILDTMLAAVYHTNGIDTLVSSNSKDFEVFKVFQVLVP
jgi:predicted nucleic acid-binding protein